MRILLSLLLACAPLAACSETAPEMPTGPARPPMWVVHDADTRLVFVGSIHQLPPALDWTGGRLATELSLADELILELAPDQSDGAAALYARMSGDERVGTVSLRFRDRAGALLDLVDDMGIDEPTADRTESWGLALAAGNALSRRQGMASDAGVEAELTRRFRQANRPISGLETAQQQLAMFDELSPADQDRLVIAALDGADQAPARTRQLLAAWAAGDVEALAIVADEAMADTPMLVEPVVRARNRAWAEQLTRRLQRPGDVMIAVGLGHLVGEGSLLDELRARGHRSMRLQ
jgi:uncharacterized protein